MRRLLLAIACALVASTASATTWYVRTDGGLYGTTASTCNGQTDAAFTGANGPNCAVNHPFEIIGNRENSPRTQRIAGGDTVIIKNGSYRMGYTAGLYQSGWCHSSFASSCYMGILPSGPDAGNKTKIYGEGWDSGCSTKPELWGAAGSNRIFDMTNSSNIDMRCIDMTDHASCGGTYAGFKCAGGVDGLHGNSGIVGYNGSNNSFTNVEVHGMPFGGMYLGKQTDITMTDVELIGNAYVGLDQDTPNANDAWAGTNTFTRFKANWIGCSENYPVDGTYLGCTDQNDQGYGDGFGSPAGGTGGSYIFTDSEFRFNTSDGLDLLYGGVTGVTVERGYFEGIVGNYLKMGGGNVIVRNSQFIANCRFWDDFASKGPGFSTCRAGGNPLVISMAGAGQVDIVNNSIIGESDILIEVFTCDGGEALNIQNNVIQGNGGGNPAAWFYAYLGCTSGLITTSTAKNNVIYAVEGSPCTNQTDCLNQNPNFTSANFTTDVFDLRLQAGSVAIDHGLNSGTVVGQTTVPTVDFNSDARPATDVDSGAIEFGASTDPLMGTCALPAGTVGVAYDYTIPVSGGDTPYTLCDESVGALPAGSPAFASTATVDGCQITGTPTGAASTDFTERVTDSSAATDTEPCTLVVTAATPTITTTTLPDGIVGFVYSASIAVSGGTLPYMACDETVGALPDGLTSTVLQNSCLIYGIPTVANTFNFTERVTDSGAQTDDQSLSIEIAASVGTITYSVNQGSDSVVARYGFVGLPEDADCIVLVRNATTLQEVGSALSTSGPARRVGVVTGITPVTEYTATFSCDVPSAEQTTTFTTYPASAGAQTVRFALGAPTVLPTAARATVDCDDNAALSSPTSVQNTSCASGCSIDQSLTAGVWYCRHRWQTAGDAVLATSAVQAFPIP